MLYSAPRFFARGKEKLRGVIEYCALNYITKVEIAPISPTNEMYEKLGEASYFLKLDFETSFFQKLISPKETEKVGFKSKYGH